MDWRRLAGVGRPGRPSRMEAHVVQCLARPAFFEPIVDRYFGQWDTHGHPYAPEVGAAWHMFGASDSQVARKRREPGYHAYHEWMQQVLKQVNRAIPAHQARPFDFE